jgi:Putative peptidoglycan binding domain
MKTFLPLCLLISLAFAPLTTAGNDKKSNAVAKAKPARPNAAGSFHSAGGNRHQGNAMLHQGNQFHQQNQLNKAGKGQLGLHNRGLNNRVALHNHLNGTARARAFQARGYSAVFHNYHRAFHERFWWRSHYSRVLLVGGGWYYWDAGYWYPAWGYDPGFAFYAYDGPIYSYDNLPPDQVILNVQSELQFQGYYTGPVDGQLGPLTRAAIADYQRDHSLEVTSAVDEDTINALGLT